MNLLDRSTSSGSDAITPRFYTSTGEPVPGATPRSLRSFDDHLDVFQHPIRGFFVHSLEEQLVRDFPEGPRADLIVDIERRERLSALRLQRYPHRARHPSFVPRGQPLRFRVLTVRKGLWQLHPHHRVDDVERVAQSLLASADVADFRDVRDIYRKLLRVVQHLEDLLHRRAHLYRLRDFWHRCSST